MNSTVKSNTEQPFQSIAKFQHALRYNSAGNVAIELALPEDRIKGFQREFGQDCRDLLEGCGDATIDFGLVENRGNDGADYHVRSVLVTGSVHHVTYLRSVLRRLASHEVERRRDQTSLIQDTPRPFLAGKRAKYCDFKLRPGIAESGAQVFDAVIPEAVWTRVRGEAEHICQRYKTSHPDSGARIEPGPVHEHFDRDLATRSLVVVGGGVLPHQLKDLFRVYVRSDTLKEHSAHATGRHPTPNQPPEMGPAAVRQVGRSNGGHGDVVSDKAAPSGGSHVTTPAILPRTSDVATSPSGIDVEFPVERVHRPNALATAPRFSLLPHTIAQDFHRRPGMATMEDLRNALRAAMRPLMHPLVVITTNTSTNHVENRPRGVAVSSFTAVTMSPPTISFNLKLPSRTWTAMQGTRHIAVHVLAATPEAATIAGAFTKPYEDPQEPFKSLRKHSYVKVGDADSRFSAPSLKAVNKSSNPIAGIIYAEVIDEKCIEVGDHIIVVAGVTHVSFPGFANVDSKAIEQRAEHANVLSYGRRAFRKPGPEIKHAELVVPFPDDEAEARHALATASKMQRLSGYMRAGLSNTTEHDAEAMEDAMTVEKAEKVWEEDFAAQERQRISEDAEIRETKELEFHKLAEQSVDGLDAPGEMNDIIEPDNTVDTAGLKESSDQLAQDSAHVRRDVNQHPPPPAPSHDTPKQGGTTNTSWGRGIGVQPPVKRDYSTSACTPGGPRRYSTFTPHSSIFSSVASQSDPPRTEPATAKHAPTPIDLVSSAAILSQTVADFMGAPLDEQRPRPQRMKQLYNLSCSAELASKELTSLQGSDQFTAARARALEATISSSTRRLARTVASRAAVELRLMLDTGRVDRRRSPWLEGAVERGMAVLDRESQDAEALARNGDVSVSVVQTFLARLRQERDVLSVEAGRLKSMMEEDEDDGGGSDVGWDDEDDD